MLETNRNFTGRFLLGRARTAMDREDQAILERSVSTVRTVAARTVMVRRGERLHSSALLVDGFVGRYLDDREGYRQLASIQVPGDFVDLHGFPLKHLDHDLVTLGPCTIAEVEHDTLSQIEAERPRLARWLWYSTLLDAAIHREWIFRLGRLGADGRLAHLFCELDARLAMVGLATDGRFALPATQADLAEACGITGVHVNRVLRSMREGGLATFRGGEVHILDRKRLTALAEFDPVYLYGEGSPWVAAVGTV